MFSRLCLIQHCISNFDQYIRQYIQILHNTFYRYAINKVKHNCSRVLGIFFQEWRKKQREVLRQNETRLFIQILRGGDDKSDQEGNKLQRPNSGFIQHTPHEAQYTS
jgi:hypothetical protein